MRDQAVDEKMGFAGRLRYKEKEITLERSEGGLEVVEVVLETE